MNNSWSNEQYQNYQMQMQLNNMGMPLPQQQMMPQHQQMMPPLMPPICMSNELNLPPPGLLPTPSEQGLENKDNSALIGPIMPDNLIQEDMNVVDEEIPGNTEITERDSRGGRGDRKEKDNYGRRDRRRSKDRSNGRDRDRYRDRNDRDRGSRDRSDRNRNDRDKNRDRNRERLSKWDNDLPLPGQQLPGVGVVSMANMIPYNNINNVMGQQGLSMDMQNMTTMTNMPNMQNMQNMNTMTNMLPGMTMMPNMVEQNMIMNQSMLIPNAPIYMACGALLPPMPGAALPNRRERPPGCRTVFVGGLPTGVKEDYIHEIFQRFGNISDIRLHRQGVCHVRFEKQESVEQAFYLSGYRLKSHQQMDSEAITLFIDYALNRDDQNEHEKSKRRESSPARVETFSPQTLSAITEKIKSDDQFIEAAPTLIVWLERGECNKKNSGMFYSLIQATNNQLRRLFTEKEGLDEEYHTMKTTLREKFSTVVTQFEQVAKVLTAAKHQRVSDHFTKVQRRNVEMWLKMTEEVENIKEEFNSNFDEDEIEKIGKNVVAAEKYEALKTENENLIYELEGYKNEAYLAKDEAERKFETFKAHFVAQQALQNRQQGQQVFPPLPPPMSRDSQPNERPQPPPPTPDDNKIFTSGPPVPPSEAKLISILTAFLMVHPLGASVDYLVSYVRSMVPNVTQATVHQVLQKYTDVFCCKTKGIGANIEHRWSFTTFDLIKSEC